MIDLCLLQPFSNLLGSRWENTGSGLLDVTPDKGSGGHSRLPELSQPRAGRSLVMVSPMSNNSHRIVASQIGRDLKHDHRIQLLFKAFNLLSTASPLDKGLWTCCSKIPWHKKYNGGIPFQCWTDLILHPAFLC